MKVIIIAGSEKDEKFIDEVLIPATRRGDDKAVKKFGHGGDVCVGGGSDRTQGGRSAVRGTKFSGTY